MFSGFVPKNKASGASIKGLFLFEDVGGAIICGLDFSGPIALNENILSSFFLGVTKSSNTF